MSLVVFVVNETWTGMDRSNGLAMSNYVKGNVPVLTTDQLIVRVQDELT